MKLAIMLTRPPYGDMQAAEAVRYASVAVSGDAEPVLVLTDGGVLLARKGQSTTGTGYANLMEHLAGIMDMGCRVIADRSSMEALGMETSDLIEGVEPVHGYDISEIARESDRLMIF